MKFTLLLILIISSTLLSAQDSTEKRGYPTFRLEEIEVTDSRTGIELKDLGKQVEVITQYEISQMPVNSVDELLRYIPGVEIQSRGMYGTQADITMRGGTYNQTLILLDGIRIGDPMTGHFNSNIPVTLSAIRRIEIIKGASSVIYGADAVGGVINIVTFGLGDFIEMRRPIRCGVAWLIDIEEKKEATDVGLKLERESVRFHGLEVGIGDFSTYKTGIMIPISNDNLYYDISYSHSESFGHPAFNNTHNYGFNIHTGGTSFNFKLNDFDYFAFRLSSDFREFDARYFYTASPLDKSNEQIGRYYGQTKLRISSYEGHDITANLGLIYTSDDFVFNPAFTPNNHKTISVDLNLHDQIKLGESTAMTIGTELQFNNMRSTDRGNRSQQQLGLYTVGVHDFSSNFNINAGLRGEYLPTHNWEVVPTIGANYYLTDKVKIRANAGRSIRTPDYTERYVSTGLEGILSAGRNLGKPDLLPEISWNYEVGTDIRFTKEISLNLTGYKRDSKNIIDYGFRKGSEITNNQNLDPEFEYLYAQNLAELQVEGLEFKISYDGVWDSFLNSDIYVGGNFINLAASDNISSKYITNAAGLNFNFGVNQYITTIKSFGIRSIFVRFDAIYRNRDITESQSINFGLTKEYFVLDGNLEFLFGETLELNLSVKNIFNADYSDILGVQLPGRWISATAKLSFDQVLSYKK